METGIEPGNDRRGRRGRGDDGCGDARGVWHGRRCPRHCRHGPV